MSRTIVANKVQGCNRTQERKLRLGDAPRGASSAAKCGGVKDRCMAVEVDMTKWVRKAV
ncbi:MAG TPA: hypothetical protein VGX70_10640 [Gemmataceae bacterium]|nr:hypothetical protein [Gemmataceae bacterium]